MSRPAVEQWREEDRLREAKANAINDLPGMAVIYAVWVRDDKDVWHSLGFVSKDLVVAATEAALAEEQISVVEVSIYSHVISMEDGEEVPK